MALGIDPNTGKLDRIVAPSNGGGYDIFGGYKEVVEEATRDNLQEWLNIVSDTTREAIHGGIDTIFQTQGAKDPVIESGSEPAFLNGLGLDKQWNILGLSFTTKTALLSVLAIAAVGFIANKVL